MAKTKKRILPVGTLRPLYTHDPKGLQVDEAGELFNKHGDRRGVCQRTHSPALQIANSHNWHLLQIAGTKANLMHMLGQLTPCTTIKEYGIRSDLVHKVHNLCALLKQEVEASREQAKKNLKD